MKKSIAQIIILFLLAFLAGYAGARIGAHAARQIYSETKYSSFVLIDKWGFEYVSVSGFDQSEPTDPAKLDAVSIYEPIVTRQNDGWHINLNTDKRR